MRSLNYGLVAPVEGADERLAGLLRLLIAATRAFRRLADRLLTEHALACAQATSPQSQHTREGIIMQSTAEANATDFT